MYLKSFYRLEKFELKIREYYDSEHVVMSITQYLLVHIYVNNMLTRKVLTY